MTKKERPGRRKYLKKTGHTVRTIIKEVDRGQEEFERRYRETMNRLDKRALANLLSVARSLQ